MGSFGEWPDLLGHVALNLGVRPRPAPMPTVQGPAIYLDFFARSLDCALTPHLRRHTLAAAARLNAKNQSSEWLQEQAREGVSNPVWYR